MSLFSTQDPVHADVALIEALFPPPPLHSVLTPRSRKFPPSTTGRTPRSIVEMTSRRVRHHFRGGSLYRAEAPFYFTLYPKPLIFARLFLQPVQVPLSKINFFSLPCVHCFGLEVWHLLLFRLSPCFFGYSLYCQTSPGFLPRKRPFLPQKALTRMLSSPLLLLVFWS